jgi:RNA polymerase sigma-70 factor, ECF subfamily
MEAFAAGLTGRTAPLPSELAPLVERRWGEAAAQWPALGIDAPVFLRYWAERIQPDEDVEAAVGGAHVADLLLACGCAAAVPSAIAEFDRILDARVGGWLSRVVTSPGFVDEVKQAARVRLLVEREAGRARIADYSGRGPLAAWVRVSVVHLALNLRRRDFRDLPVSDIALATEHPELRYLKGLDAPTLQEALRTAMASLSTRERNLLRLHHLDGMSTPEIAALFRTHRTTVRRQLNDCHGRLRDAVRTYLREQMGLADSSIDSLLRLPGALDLSLTVFLASSDGA